MSKKPSGLESIIAVIVAIGAVIGFVVFGVVRIWKHCSKHKPTAEPQWADVSTWHPDVAGWMLEARLALQAHNEDAARLYYQKAAYGSPHLTAEQNQTLKAEITQFVATDSKYQYYIAPLRQAVQQNEGILQSKLYAVLDVHDEQNKEAIRYIAYFAHELGDIVRIKSGRSYRLYSSQAIADQAN